MAERYITLAIHTYDHAVALRRVLESHELEVRFENLYIDNSEIPAGVRVKIEEHHLPLALKLMESGDISVFGNAGKPEGEKWEILIPVDFSKYGMTACRIGFELAQKLDFHPVLMHAFATPYFNGSMGFVNPGEDDMVPSMESELSGMEMTLDMKKESERRMRIFRQKIKEKQASGEIADIKFSTTVSEGIPEDVIKEYCRSNRPALVVMATRGKDKKEEQLIGSVTAEVLDSCRVPVFAFPESVHFESLDSFRRVAFFCNLDQQDILCVDSLMRTFDYPEVEVVLIPVNDRVAGSIKEKVELLKDYFNKNYPVAHFSSEVFPVKTFSEDFENFASQSNLDLMIVPNKKQNIFRRLFNPGIAHKLLFDRELPLLAMPV